MKTKILKKIVMAGLAVAMMLTMIAVPNDVLAKSKETFRLSKKSISISKDTRVSLTSGKKNDRISVTVQKPDIAAVTQTSQKGKKTIFTISPKQKGSTKVIFRSGKKTATLKVKVTKTSLDTIKNGFSARMVIDNQQGNNGMVHIMVYNHTGLDLYFADWVKIQGDLDYDGHWFDSQAQGAAQFTTQYALIRNGEEKQVDYYNAPVYGQRLDSRFAIMTFQKQAYVTMTVYFGTPSADNAYTAVVDTNGVASVTKQ